MTITHGRVEQVSEAPAFVVNVTTSPERGKALRDFTMNYEVTLEHLVTHWVLVSERSDVRHGVVADGGRVLRVIEGSTRDFSSPHPGRIDHPFVLVAVLAFLALLARLVPARPRAQLPIRHLTPVDAKTT